MSEDLRVDIFHYSAAVQSWDHGKAVQSRKLSSSYNLLLSTK